MASRRDWARHLAREAPLPVYALTGAVPLLVDEAVTALRARVVTAQPAFNADALSAQAGCGQAAVDAARQLPVLAPRRWVHVAPIARLAARDQAALLAYLAQPATTTTLCLSGDKLDLRTKLGRALAERGAHFALEPPREADLPAWIAARAAAMGAPLTADAADLLCCLVGDALGTMLQALEAVALYAGTARPLTAEHVGAAVAATRATGIFALTDAVGSRQFSRASVLLHEVLGGGESGLWVLTMLTRQLRQLLALKELSGRPLAPAARAQAAGVRPFLLQALEAQAARFSRGELLGALAAARRADLQLKSTRLRPALILDAWLAAIAPPQAAAG